MKCNHEIDRLCTRTLSNGVRHYAMQCLNCGQQTRAVPKESVGTIMIERGIKPGTLPTWDESIRKDYLNLMLARRDNELACREPPQSGPNALGFWERYNNHLSSEKWASLRRLVFRRCNGICEGCGINKAVQVHHLSYQNLGDELLWELRAVCMACHEKIHPHMVETVRATVGGDPFVSRGSERR